MAKYSNIKGFTVQTLSSDTVASQQAGGTWASGGDLNTARRSGGGAGTQTAGLAFGGNVPPAVANTETYNGTSFTEVADLNSARQDIAGCGTQTAALSVGGGPGDQALTELWNGSGWTEVADLNTGRENVKSQSAGTSTASIMWGGYNPNGTGRAVNESWNGSSWTEVADLNTGRYDSSGNGTSTAAVVVGGTNGSTLISGVEEWDGSSWTETTEANTNRTQGSASGTYQDLLYYSGGPPATGKTEFWNGSTWTEVNDMATSRFACTESRGATSSAVYAAGGRVPSVVATTEEFTAPATFTKQIEGQLFFNSTANAFKETIKDAPTGTWASGGTMNQARIYSLITSVSGGPSGQSDAFAVSGANPSTSNVANAETYNGSSWTEVGDVNSARRLGNGCGGQPAAVVAGGYTTTDVASTEVWNGSSWTETGDLNSAKRQFAGSFGTTDSSSDLLVAGAFPLTANTEIWDGSSWTETGNLNQQRYDGAGFGTSSAAGLIAGGQSSPSPIPGQTAFAENWNGSSWTEVAEFNTNRFYLAAAGEQTDGLIFGGNLDPGLSGTTEIWNGSSWTELNDMSAGVQGNGGGGSSVAAISFSGDIGPGAGGTTSEEFTASLSNKTITAS